MKEVKLFLIIATFLIIGSHMQFALAQTDNPLGNLPGADIVDKFSENNNYLISEWKTTLLESKYIKWIDTALTKLSFLFVFLFGEAYSFSLTLLLAIVLWVFFADNLSNIFKSFMSVPKYLSIIMGIALTIIMAQFGILHAIGERIIWFVSSQDTWWWRVAIISGAIIVLVLLTYLRIKFGAVLEAAKEKRERQKEKFNRQILDAYGKPLSEAGEEAGKI